MERKLAGKCDVVLKWLAENERMAKWDEVLNNSGIDPSYGEEILNELTIKGFIVAHRFEGNRPPLVIINDQGKSFFLSKSSFRRRVWGPQLLNITNIMSAANNMYVIISGIIILGVSVRSCNRDKEIEVLKNKIEVLQDSLNVSAIKK